MIYLALGSNVGDRSSYLAHAIEKLGEIGTVSLQSKVYETDPWGNTDQPAFLNQCIGLDTKIAPEQLIKLTQHLEFQLGRTQSEHWGPREIDIDILLAEDQTIELPNLSIPHPYLHERAFVLVPLAEIAGDVVHPGRNRTIDELLSKVDTSGVRPF